MKVNIYKSYGVLAHEKHPFYSFGRPASDIYDVIAVDVPNVVGTNEPGEPLLELDGMTFLLSEVLTNRGEKPAIAWVNGKTHRFALLKSAE